MNNQELLNELYEYTQIEETGVGLTKYQTKRYIEIVNILYENNVKIPFGIVL